MWVPFFMATLWKKSSRRTAKLAWIALCQQNKKYLRASKTRRQTSLDFNEAEWGKNHWTMKYRSLWPTSIIRPIIVSHWLIIQMYDMQQSNIDFKIQDKLTWPWNTVTYIYFEVKGCVALTHYPKVWCSAIKQSSRYKAKSLNHEL